MNSSNDVTADPRTALALVGDTRTGLLTCRRTGHTMRRAGRDAVACVLANS